MTDLELSPREAWQRKLITFRRYLLSKYRYQVEVSERIILRILRKKIITLPCEGEAIIERMGGLRKRFEHYNITNSVTIYYGKNKIQHYHCDEFSKAQLSNRLAAMCRVAEIEIQNIKRGG
jgi:hypothetical protein